MFAVITLEKSLDVVVVPVEWIKGFDLVNSVNDGINCSEPHVVYWSRDDQMPPNFFMPIMTRFNYIDRGCFSARLNKFFGKFKLCVEVSIFELLEVYV